MATRSGIEAGKAFVLVEAVDRTAIVLEGVRARLKNFANDMQSMGTIMLKVGIMAALPIGASVKQFADMEEQYHKISKMLPDPAPWMEKYITEIDNLSSQYGVAAKDVADGIYQVLNAGADPSSVVDILRTGVKGAVAGSAEIGQTMKAIMAMMTAYNVKAAETSKITDMMFSTDIRGFTNFKELSENLGRIANLGDLAGISMEELGAAISTLTRSAIPTDVAITGLRGELMEFFNAGEEAQRVFQRVAKANNMPDVRMSSSLLQVKGLLGVFDMFRKANVSPDELASMFPDARKLTSVITLYKNMGGFVDDYHRQLMGAGATQIAFEKMQGTTAQTFRRVWQGVLYVARSLGGVLAPAVIDIGTKFAVSLMWVGRWIKEHKDLVIAVTATVLAIITMGTVLTASGLALRLLAFSMSPMIWGLRLLSYTTKATMSVIGWSTKLAMGVFTTSLKAGFSVLKFLFMTVLPVVLHTGLSLLMGFMSTIVNLIALGPWGAALAVVLGLTAALLALISIPVIGGGVKGILRFLADIPGMAKDAGLAFLHMFDGLWDFAVHLFPKIKALGYDLMDTLKAVSNAVAFGDTDAAWEVGLAGLKLSWYRFNDIIQEVWKASLEKISGMWDSFYSSITDMDNPMVAFISELLSEIRDAVYALTYYIRSLDIFGALPSEKEVDDYVQAQNKKRELNRQLDERKREERKSAKADQESLEGYASQVGYSPYDLYRGIRMYNWVNEHPNEGLTNPEPPKESPFSKPLKGWEPVKRNTRYVQDPITGLYVPVESPEKVVEKKVEPPKRPTFTDEDREFYREFLPKMQADPLFQDAVKKYNGLKPVMGGKELYDTTQPPAQTNPDIDQASKEFGEAVNKLKEKVEKAGTPWERMTAVREGSNELLRKIMGNLMWQPADRNLGMSPDELNELLKTQQRIQYKDSINPPESAERGTMEAAKLQKEQFLRMWMENPSDDAAYNQRQEIIRQIEETNTRLKNMQFVPALENGV